jgi:hypothetical protein
MKSSSSALVLAQDQICSKTIRNLFVILYWYNYKIIITRPPNHKYLSMHIMHDHYQVIVDTHNSRSALIGVHEMHGRMHPNWGA